MTRTAGPSVATLLRISRLEVDNDHVTTLETLPTMFGEEGWRAKCTCGWFTKPKVDRDSARHLADRHDADVVQMRSMDRLGPGWRELL